MRSLQFTGFAVLLSGVLSFGCGESPADADGGRVARDGDTRREDGAIRTDGGGPTFHDVMLIPLPDPGPCAEDPLLEEVSGPSAHLKSPGPRMHFTSGQPLRILAGEGDPEQWRCPPGHPPYVCEGTRMDFFIDDELVGSLPPNPDGQSHWELRLPGGISVVGNHVLDVQYVPVNPAGGTGTPVSGRNPAIIIIDPPPTHGTTLTLTEDLVLSGSTPLDWTDTTVIGNGFTVTSADGYNGRVTITNAAVFGLGDYGGESIDVATSAEMTVTDSIFEASAPLHLGVMGSAPMTVSRNEFRANNLVTYVASNPGATPVLELEGSTSGAKNFQGNRVGGGIVILRGARGWQIGGIQAGQGNILMGPRAVLQVEASGAIVQGNYLHHVYRGGWSQGFNLVGADDGTIEHNVIHQGSWPIQSVGGLFQYNLVVDSGHDWWRSAQPNTTIYRNVFVHTDGPDGSFNGGLYFYGDHDETGLVINGNTFDAGGEDSNFYSAAIVFDGNSGANSIRNNVFTGFSDGASALIDIGGGTVSSADYNAWFNPDGAAVPHYADEVAGTPGTNDVDADPAFSLPRDRPYSVRDGCIWEGSYTARDVLSYYRGMYLPLSSSPLINAGDPADGDATDIGAVDGNGDDANDRFGRTLQ